MKIKEIEPIKIEGDISHLGEATILENGERYAASDDEGKIIYDVSDVDVSKFDYVNFDSLLDGEHNVTFHFTLIEATSGGTVTRLSRWLSPIRSTEPDRFDMIYQILPQCPARMRLSLEMTEHTERNLHREGAILKPVLGGDRIDLENVEKIELSIYRSYGSDVHFSQTPIQFSTDELPPLEDPALPEGPLIDEFGQSAIRDWESRTESEDELVSRLQRQYRRVNSVRWPPEYSRWGGFQSKKFESTGYFHTRKIDGRWMLVDPDGHPFWSSGVMGLRSCIKTTYEGLENALTWLPEEHGEFGQGHDQCLCEQLLPDPEEVVNYLCTNFIRAFGSSDWREKWCEITESQIRRFGFNTIGSDSDEWAIDRIDMPYVYPLYPRFPEVPKIALDFPDVFDPQFVEGTMEVAEELRGRTTDPGMIGYTLGNEPNWLFRSVEDESPAVGMLYQTETCRSRTALSRYLANKYDRELKDVWGMDVDYDDITSGKWERELTGAALADLHEFSGIMAERYFELLSNACAEVDENHLNLGPRFVAPPPDWMFSSLQNFDAVSVNIHSRTVPDAYGQLSEGLDIPILVTEWASGALDVGLPAPGLCSVSDQEARGEHFRLFQQSAAAKPWCIGAHYFRVYDHSALGRTDGETYNNGILDVCHSVYEPLLRSSRDTHEKLYDVAFGREAPQTEFSGKFQNWQ